MPICHFSDKSSTTRQSEAKNLECINYLPSREGNKKNSVQLCVLSGEKKLPLPIFIPKEQVFRIYTHLLRLYRFCSS